jgi:hypothetical protein
LTGRLGAVGAVGWPSDGHGVAQAASGGGATGGGASAAAQRRRATAQTLHGARVHRFAAAFHQDVQRRTASTKVASKSGERRARWRATGRRGGGTPVRPSQRCRALRRERTTPKRSSPCGEASDETDGDGAAAGRRGPRRRAHDGGLLGFRGAGSQRRRRL